MKKKGRNRFSRSLGVRRYKRMFVISTEGTNTEPQYFKSFNSETTVIQIQILKNKGSAPGTVLREMQRYLKENDLKNDDQAWLVVDRDSWKEDQLVNLHKWSQANEQFGLALSNPKFEYWLLLHFEEGNGISSSRQCSAKLLRYLPDYDKNLDMGKLRDNVTEAVERAKKKDSPPCSDWPRNNGTTVYRLVQAILNKGDNL